MTSNNKDLRHFRFNKNVLPSIPKGGNSIQTPENDQPFVIAKVESCQRVVNEVSIPKQEEVLKHKQVNGQDAVKPKPVVKMEPTLPPVPTQAVPPQQKNEPMDDPNSLKALTKEFPYVRPEQVERKLMQASGDGAKARKLLVTEYGAPNVTKDWTPNPTALRALKQILSKYNNDWVELCYNRAKGDCTLARKYVKDDYYAHTKWAPTERKPTVIQVPPPGTSTPTALAPGATSAGIIPAVIAVEPKAVNPTPPSPTTASIVHEYAAKPKMIVAPTKIVYPTPRSDEVKIVMPPTSNGVSTLQIAQVNTLVIPPLKDPNSFSPETNNQLARWLAMKKAKKRKKKEGSTEKLVKKVKKKIKKVKKEEPPPEPVKPVIVEEEPPVEPVSEGEEEETNNYSTVNKPVFDSDEDSDVEISDTMGTEQQTVHDFLETATMSELLCIEQCSQKKADAIVECRPFSGWNDVINKFKDHKLLSTEILNNAQYFLNTRSLLTQMMKKCSKLSSDLERVNFRALAIDLPSTLSKDVTLAPHQVIGLKWLITLNKRGLNGILADEMGLGKTIQIIAFLAWYKEAYKETHEAHLIVVPASTLENWKKELERWCPSLDVFLYYGSATERRAMRSEIAQGVTANIDIVLTTYNLITATPEERKMFKVVKFAYVCMDEAHMLKNMNTKRYEQLIQINARHRILVTGTPLQNNLLELMSLLSFVLPHFFMGEQDRIKAIFMKKANGKAKGSDAESDSEITKFEKEKIEHAKRIMKPFVLRRLKTEVLHDLPKKTIMDVLVNMSDRQRTLYTQLEQRFSEYTESQLEDVRGVNMTMHLRKVACHPLLVREIYTDAILQEILVRLMQEPEFRDKDEELLMMDLSYMSDFELHTLCKNHVRLNSFTLTNEQICDCGKFKELDELLPDLESSGHRTLIFSQFQILLNVLQEYLDIKGYKYLRLDGNTPVIERQDLIDTYNNDPSIFLFILTTKAGGLGINLTAADSVIMYDLDFNPFNDKQAEDRCHRVGQIKPVTVRRLILNDSIELHIRQIAQTKLKLGSEISNDDKQDNKAFLKQVLNIKMEKES